MSGEQIKLFEGAHVPQVQFENALLALDLCKASAHAPGQWKAVVEQMAMAVEGDRPAPVALDALLEARRDDWPDYLERTWQRLVGRALDERDLPGVLHGKPAAAFLLRGGDMEMARSSVERHLEYHPRDPEAWKVLSVFEPVWGAIRCAFHGGPLLEPLDELVDEIESDDLSPVGDWVLPYAVLTGKLWLQRLGQVLEVEGLLEPAFQPVPGSARAFAFFLYEAERARLRTGKLDARVLEARRGMKKTSAVAFRRYLEKVR